MPLETAVTGGGVVSRTHLSGLRKNPRTDLMAICDVDDERARELSDEYNIDAFTDTGRMLAELDLDWVHVCTPVKTHLEVSTQAIRAGVPILIEKPVTATIEQFDELESTARSHDVRVSVVHQHLFTPAIREARRRIGAGTLGKVHGVDLHFTGLTPPDVRNRGDWTFDLPGGEFEEGLPHPIYLTLELGGFPNDRDAIQAVTSLDAEYEAEFAYDRARIQYRSQDGTLCSAAMHSSTTPQRLIHIHGADASLTVDLISQTLIGLDRAYDESSLGRAWNNVDRASDRVAGTVQNALAVARRRVDNSWDLQRRLNPHYYQFDVEARALEGGADSATFDTGATSAGLERAGWTIAVLEQIRGASEKKGIPSAPERP
jgi:predicted dehydrogenase